MKEENKKILLWAQMIFGIAFGLIALSMCSGPYI